MTWPRNDRVTWLTSVPTMLVLVARERELIGGLDFASVERVTMGSAPLTQALPTRATRMHGGYSGPPGVAGWMVALDGNHAYQTVVFDRSGETVISAQAGADVGGVLDDPSVSAPHCKVVGRSGYFVIVDLDSKNGVVVDGEKVGEKTLKSGMRIRLGKTTFVF